MADDWSKKILSLRILGILLLIGAVSLNLYFLFRVPHRYYCCIADGTSLQARPAVLFDILGQLFFFQVLKVRGYRLSLFLVSLSGLGICFHRQFLLAPCRPGFELCLAANYVFASYVYFCLIMLALAAFDKYVQKAVDFFKAWRVFPVYLILISFWHRYDSFNGGSDHTADNRIAYAILILVLGELISLGKRALAWRKQKRMESNSRGHPIT